MPSANPKPSGSRTSWFWPWCAVLLAAVGALVFRHLAHSAPQKASAAPDTPFVRIALGADLWILFDSSVRDHNPRRFPAYAVDPVVSRSILEYPFKEPPRELLVIAQAERFLSEEFLSQYVSSPIIHIAAGPILRENSLALVMSRETQQQILKAASTPPRTLLDWLGACAAASRPGQPITFYMADPNECSASWIGLSELLAEQMGNLDRKQLGAQADSQLSHALDGLGKQISVQGISDRLELYKLLLGHYPAGAVLLTYDHLAQPLQQDYAGDYTFVVPEKHFHPMVQALILTPSASFDASRYLPTLLQSWSDHGLVQASAATAPPDDPNRVPTFGTMHRILVDWNSRPK